MPQYYVVIPAMLSVIFTIFNLLFAHHIYQKNLSMVRARKILCYTPTDVLIAMLLTSVSTILGFGVGVGGALSVLYILLILSWTSLFFAFVRAVQASQYPTGAQDSKSVEVHTEESGVGYINSILSGDDNTLKESAQDVSQGTDFDGNGSADADGLESSDRVFESDDELSEAMLPLDVSESLSETGVEDVSGLSEADMPSVHETPSDSLTENNETGSTQRANTGNRGRNSRRRRNRQRKRK